MPTRGLTEAPCHPGDAQNKHRAVRDLVEEGAAEYTLPDRMSEGTG